MVEYDFKSHKNTSIYSLPSRSLLPSRENAAAKISGKSLLDGIVIIFCCVFKSHNAATFVQINNLLSSGEIAIAVIRSPSSAEQVFFVLPRYVPPAPGQHPLLVAILAQWYAVF